MGTLQRLKTALSSSNLIGRKKIFARKRTNLLICDKFSPSVLFSTSFWSLAVIIDSKRRLIDPRKKAEEEIFANACLCEGRLKHQTALKAIF